MHTTSGLLQLEMDFDFPRVQIWAAGEVDASTSAALVDAVDAAAGLAATREVVLDLTHVEFLGSPGLTALVNATRSLDSTGRRLLIVPSEVVQRAIAVTGLKDRLHVQSPLQQAVPRPSVSPEAG